MGDVLRLVVAELQMECIQKVAFVNGLERDVHRVSPCLLYTSVHPRRTRVADDLVEVVVTVPLQLFRRHARIVVKTVDDTGDGTRQGSALVMHAVAHRVAGANLKDVHKRQGKMTVGQELMKITDVRLFHNHMTLSLIHILYAKLVNSASAPLPVCQRNGIMRSGNCFDRGG